MPLEEATSLELTFTEVATDHVLAVVLQKAAVRHLHAGAVELPLSRHRGTGGAGSHASGRGTSSPASDSLEDWRCRKACGRRES